ncbi:MAG: response regulator, partial [Thomasclavelia spiroformis]
INLPGINGLETIASAKKINKDIVSLVLTSYNYFEYAKEAIKLGVEDFIIKPVSNEKMFNAIYQVINKIDSRES